MKHVVIVVFTHLALILPTKSVQFWFSLGTGTPDVYSVSLGGQEEQYVIQGKQSQFKAYEINWEDGSTTSTQDIDLGTRPNIQVHTAIQTDNTLNVVVSSRTIFRFTIQSGVQDSGFEEYSVPTGSDYSYPFWLLGTNYMFIPTRSFPSSKRKAYRMLSDRVSDVKTFNTGGNSKSFGVLSGTIWFLIGLDGSNQRKLFDYTNGYEGGTNSAVQIHSKPDSSNEVGFFSPEDGRGYYVVASQSTKRLYTVSHDGTERLNHHLSSIGNIHPSLWIRDSDFCVVSSWGTQFAIVNFMDLGKPAPTYYTVESGGSKTFQPEVSLFYKVFIIPSAQTHQSFVYKVVDEMPCGDLCATCDGVLRRKCQTCVPNAFKSGSKCSCGVGFSEEKISPTRKKCSTCSPLCATCSGGGAQECLSCRYPDMEKKEDGSCGCPLKSFQSGTSCLGCHGSCLTCSGPGQSECLSCDFANGQFLRGGTCLSCHPSCKTCSGGESNQCLSCDVSNGKYLSSGSCLSCDPSCRSCQGAGASSCLDCPHSGFFLSSGKCHSCARTNSSQSCPSPVKLSFPQTLVKLSQNLTITFTPALIDPLFPDFKITAQDLVEKHLRFTYKRKTQEEHQTLIILEKRLTHTSNGSSELFIRFLQKMRVSNTESIDISVEDPWLYQNSQPGVGQSQNSQKVVYFKEENHKAKIVNSGDTKDRYGYDQDREGENNSFTLTQIARLIITLLLVLTVILAAVVGLRSSMIRALRFFNILEILSNLAKINVIFSPRINSTIDFINALKFPEIGFLLRFSPLKDTFFDDPDVDKYQIIPRGSRGKITSSNRDIFIASGQNFAISIFIISLWVSFTLLRFCSKKRNKIYKVLVFVYQLVFGLVFFDYQMICLTEVAVFDYSSLGKHSFKSVLSLLLSLSIVLLVAYEYYKGANLIRRSRREQFLRLSSNSKNTAGEELGEISYGDRLILEKYTDSLSQNLDKNCSYFILVETVRFFWIQVVIASLQLLNRIQALLVLSIDLIFYFYFIKQICSQTVFSSKFQMVKTFIQESCVFITILTMTVFSFSENSNFSSSFVYKIIEVSTIASILVASGTEFAVVLAGAYLDSQTWYKNNRKSADPRKKILSKKSRKNQSEGLEEGRESEERGIDQIKIEDLDSPKNKLNSGGNRKIRKFRDRRHPRRSLEGRRREREEAGEEDGDDKENELKKAPRRKGITRKFVKKPPTTTKLRFTRMGMRMGRRSQVGTNRAMSGFLAALNQK